jgi:glycerol uptake facilitator-like aquaporin
MSCRPRSPGYISSEPDDVVQLLRAAAAEFIGSFVVGFCSCAAVVSNSDIFEIACAVSRLHRARTIPPILLSGLALQYGLAVMVTSFSLRRISGAHLNPVVSWALFWTRRIDLHAMLVYMAFQMLGSIAASFVLECAVLPCCGYTAAPPAVRLSLDFAVAIHGAGGLGAVSSLGVTMPGEHVTPLEAVGTEAISSFLLVLVYLSTTANVQPPARAVTAARPPSRPPARPPVRSRTRMHRI